jgi:hypothetical protein
MNMSKNNKLKARFVVALTRARQKQPGFGVRFCRAEG